MPEPAHIEKLQRELLRGREYIGVQKIEGPLLFVRKTHPVGYRELIECIDPRREVTNSMIVPMYSEGAITMIRT